MVKCIETYFLKTNIVSVFTETLTAQVDTILPDETVPVCARSATIKSKNIYNHITYIIKYYIFNIVQSHTKMYILYYNSSFCDSCINIVPSVFHTKE